MSRARTGPVSSLIGDALRGTERHLHPRAERHIGDGFTPVREMRAQLAAVVDDQRATVGRERVVRKEIAPRRAEQIVVLRERCKPAIVARLEVEHAQPGTRTVARGIDQELAIRRRRGTEEGAEHQVRPVAARRLNDRLIGAASRGCGV